MYFATCEEVFEIMKESYLAETVPSVIKKEVEKTYITQLRKR